MPYTFRDLVGIGFSPEHAQGIYNFITADEAYGLGVALTSRPRSVTPAATATGTTIADAYQITAFTTVFSTVAASTGCKLSLYLPIGQWGFIQNNGANALNVFPPTAVESINGGSAGAAVTVAAAGVGCFITRFSATSYGAYVMTREA